MQSYRTQFVATSYETLTYAVKHRLAMYTCSPGLLNVAANIQTGNESTEFLQKIYRMVLAPVLRLQL